MSQRYFWRVYCPVTSQYETVISTTEPTVCPSDGTTPVNPAFTTIMQADFLDYISSGYINVESQLADNQALKLQASNVNGGIIMSSGFGGINILTTNAVSIAAQAASNFTTSNGNLTFQATAGLVNIDAGSGINVGNASTTTPINIGTSSFSKNITIGNQTGSTNVTLYAGTGEIILNSADTTENAIQLYSSGGINTNASGIIKIATSKNTANAITLDAAFNNGGIAILSGTQGIVMSSNGGLIAIGTSGGDIMIGTASFARTITIGNTTSTTAVVISSGTGGIAIGNDTSSGEIQLGNVASAKTIILGNTTSGTRLFQRFGTGGGIIKHQEPEVTLSDANATLTISQLLLNLFTITPTTDRTLTLPTAANAVAGISGVQVNDSIDFTIINRSTSTNQASVIISSGTGGSMVGFNIVTSYSNNVGSYFDSGSGVFRLRFTNVSSSTESYVVYRIS